jgi:hypothetical protein
MYELYTQKNRRSFWSIFRKMMWLIPVFLIFYLFHLDSLKFKQQAARIQDEREKLLESFDIAISQAGYLKKAAGPQEIYIPSLRIHVSNLTDSAFAHLQFQASFYREGKTFCRGAATLMGLESWETKVLYIRCIDSAVFGSVVSGLSLMETTGTIEYVVSIRHLDRRATAARGEIEFNLLLP